MRIATLIVLVFSGTAGANNSLQVGDGQIVGELLQPYKFTWRQCSLQDGVWVASNDVTERMVIIGDRLVRVQQFSERPDGSRAVSTSYFDRESLAPLRLEQRVVAADGSALGSSEHTLTEQGYRGRMTRGEQSKTVEGAVSSNMLHGGAMGLPLATIDHQQEPLEFAASMINFDATYKVTATWAGKEALIFKGMEIEAWLIDIHWLHEGTGDIYPAGPDRSGGRYWVVNNPPKGFPYVPRYQTDTYAVEFIQGACPDTSVEP